MNIENSATNGQIFLLSSNPQVKYQHALYAMKRFKAIKSQTLNDIFNENTVLFQKIMQLEMKEPEQLSSMTSFMTKFVKSTSNTTTASFTASYELVKRGKPFMDGEYVKECFLSTAKELFAEFKNKDEIIQKLRICLCQKKL